MRWITMLVGVLAACGSDADGQSDTRREDGSGDASGDTGGAETSAPDTFRTETETSAPDTTPANPNCGTRVCGPDPVLHQDCGACTTAGLLACNDGKCEATCSPVDCARMNYRVDTCESSGECDATPEGRVLSGTFSCGLDGTTCIGAIDDTECPETATDCKPCDGGEGRCQFDECMPALAVDCPEPACPDRECGPHPVTKEDCGTCGGTTPACNNGTCEATCNPAACAAMSYTVNTCAPTSECDGSPDGAVLSTDYACDAGKGTCEATLSAVDCGLTVTDCSPCDLVDTDDGFCWQDECVTPDEASCN